MLDHITKVIDFWKIKKLFYKAYKRGGRPPIQQVMLFKALPLENWYDLSDVQIVQEIHDWRCF